MTEVVPKIHTNRITIDAVQRVVAEQFGLDLAQLCGKSNARLVVVPRQLAMYLARHLTGASFPQLGLHFGYRHHTTVMHAIKKIERQRHTDRGVAAILSTLEAALRPNDPPVGAPTVVDSAAVLNRATP